MGRDCPVLKNFIAFIGRICISLIFIVSGIMKIIHYKAMTTALANIALPKFHWFLITTIVLELLGGVLVLLGWFTRFGAFLLFVFLIAASWAFHSLWVFQGTENILETYLLLKNLSIIGGLLYVMAFGAGEYSIDHRLLRRHPY